MQVLLNRGVPQILIPAEGTYPYIRGGVSTWIHDLIGGLEEFTFGVVFLGGRREDYGEVKYKFPENLVYLSTAYLFEERERPKPKYKEGESKTFELIRKMHEGFKKGITEVPEEVMTPDFLTKVLRYEDFLYSKRAWEHIVSMYSKHASTEPFVDYFWNIRNLHAPLWVVAEVASKVKAVDFKLIHSPSTGYAGFFASLLKRSTGRPFILTEHGIYTRERKIDLMNADWLTDKRTFVHKGLGEISATRKVWVNFFMHLGALTYSSANIIVSLFDGARNIQISYGADPQKCEVVPNGVDIELYSNSLKNRPEKVPKVVALIGRVVQIKDVKTFIKAMKLLVEKLPEAEGWVVGPTDEDPDYYQECLSLVRVLGLEHKVKFLGFQKTFEIFPKIGVLTLTSISEGMPLIVLEGFAAGVPCVATDVGSCKQLIYGGLNEEDTAIGKAGEVVQVRNAQALAESYANLLKDEALWKQYQKAALERVRRFYSKETFLENYRGLYRRYLSWQA
ncbi:MAG: GT4 family glycosyltransferase PelF [Aquificaceae bacterium]|nr:GT4 family glycosyltransferase PelF [Aquificaceae bacterium]